METPHILSWLVPSQKRIFHVDLPTPSIKRLRALRNEPISVQVTSDTLPLSVYRVEIGRSKK